MLPEAYAEVEVDGVQALFPLTGSLTVQNFSVRISSRMEMFKWDEA